jgi:hypothetical protein
VSTEHCHRVSIWFPAFGVYPLNIKSACGRHPRAQLFTNSNPCNEVVPVDDPAANIRTRRGGQIGIRTWSADLRRRVTARTRLQRIASCRCAAANRATTMCAAQLHRTYLCDSPPGAETSVNDPSLECFKIRGFPRKSVRLGYRPAGGRGQIQTLGQGGETPPVLQFLRCGRQVRYLPSDPITTPTPRRSPCGVVPQAIFPAVPVKRRSRSST